MSHAKKFRTNLNCKACVSAVKPHLDNEISLAAWEVDLSNPDKILTVYGDSISTAVVRNAVESAGFKILGELATTDAHHSAVTQPEKHKATTYYPLLLIMAFLIGIVVLVELSAGSLVWNRAMSNFMGGFFLIFSFFKLLDLRGFADSYQMYDIVAKKFRGYGYAYPFIELLLGIAYLARIQPLVTNLVTLVVMLVSAIGVIKSLMAKQKIRCACLGTVFNLPMSTVTLLEDSVMAVMAGSMIFIGAHVSSIDHNQHLSPPSAGIIRMQTQVSHHHHHGR